MQARLSLHLSKCHIVGNHMAWLIYAHHLIHLTKGTMANSVDTTGRFKRFFRYTS